MLSNMTILPQNLSIYRNSTENRKKSLDNSLKNKKNLPECSENAFFSGCYSFYNIFDTDWRHFVNVLTLFGTLVVLCRVLGKEVTLLFKKTRKN